ncbi:DUF952 domain-containing protein [Pseudoroseomonas globiformis]|uniref:DUF952 domain-containing protein n=1 Tax=Teichococcus globiformis TaxID=2307229 RepID=A0ABV7G281_9PROT
MDSIIYTMVRDEDWQEARAAGAYIGSAEDAHDGFLHFSTAAQLRESAARHRPGQPDLWLVAADAEALGTTLRWEASEGSRPGLFPHLYGKLPLSAVRWAMPLPLQPDGTHLFPAEIA